MNQKLWMGILLGLASQAHAGQVESLHSVAVPVQAIRCDRNVQVDTGYFPRPMDVVRIDASALALKQKAILTHDEVQVSGRLGLCDQLEEMTKGQKALKGELRVTVGSSTSESEPNELSISESVILTFQKKVQLSSFRFESLIKR